MVGTCPRCVEPGQYGDNCEKCAATYNATELKNTPISLQRRNPGNYVHLSTTSSISRNTRSFCKSGLGRERVQPEVANKLAEWLDDGLRAWDISRDAPYFGFVIPGSAGQILLCLDGRADWLYGVIPKFLRPNQHRIFR